ncbi:T9SS type A sorting domain-containing protein [bacterium]|nr:T9SS type A sorting domain-containing protein [bacterium]
MKKIVKMIVFWGIIGLVCALYFIQCTRSPVENSESESLNKATSVQDTIILSNFTLTYDNGGVLIEWGIAFEENVLGFHLWRSEENDSFGIRINPALIPLDGALSYLDLTALNNTGYCYQLEVVYLDGASEKLVHAVACISPPEVAEKEVLPASFALSQNYPNPFNCVTTIQFVLPTTEYVQMTVYSMARKKVSILIDDPLSAGCHCVRFDASGLDEGMYLCELKAGGETRVISMLYVKD